MELPTEALPLREGQVLVTDDRDERPPEAKQVPQQVTAFLGLSRRRWMTAEAASREFRDEMRYDQKFAAGGGYQWKTGDRTAREDEGRPCLEINRIPQFIRQVSNQNRANRSQIVIKPKGKGSSVKLAAAIQGIVRGIEADSDADTAYDTATEHQLRSGLGFIRLVAQWQADEFYQVIKIRRVRNPLSVYWDPSTQDTDFFDCRFMHIIGAVGQDEYDDRWGRTHPRASLNEFMVGRNDMEDWMPEGKVVLAEYFYVTVEQREIFQLDNQHKLWATDWPAFQKAWGQLRPGEPLPQITRKRKMPKRVVRWCLHNAMAILEGNEELTAGREIPGERIPMFPLIGDEIDLDGKIDYRGMVRDARHPQQMYNFWASSIAEAVALAPKAPWIAAKGQVEDFLDDWKNSNRETKAVLLYNPKAVGDHLVPPPQRNNLEPAIQAMVMGLGQADRDLMSVMGLFQPSLGERGANTESGKARQTLVEQGIIANSNYLDNLQRTKRSLGRCILSWLPIVYDVPRIVNLIQPDGTQKAAVIYAGQENKPQEGETPKEITDLYDISVGEFDVSVWTGPSFQTEQERTQAWLLDLFKVLPPLAAMGADILLDNSTNPAAQQLAKRAKKALPPQFQDESDPESKVPIMEAELQMKTQLLEAAHKAVVELARQIETKELDNATKKQVAYIQATSQMAIAQAKLAGEQNLAVFQAELQHMQTVMDQIGQAVMLDVKTENEQQITREAQQHEEQMQAAAQGGDLQAQREGQAHEQGMQREGQAGNLQAQREGQAVDLEKAKMAMAAKAAAPKAGA